MKFPLYNQECHVQFIRNLPEKLTWQLLFADASLLQIFTILFSRLLLGFGEGVSD